MPTSREAAAVTSTEAGFWSDTIRPLAKLGKGWNRIPGRFGTGCAEDSSFSFKVMPGLPDRVLIYLNGGGACWRAQDCDPKNRPTYTMSADSGNDVSARVGIFDVNNEKNPVRDYTMIFVPYCTGDVHLGTRQSEYEWTTPKHAERSFSIRHGGAANLEAVLDWVFVNFRNPRTVVVAGLDAGAVASPVLAEKVARHYSRARVVQFGEGSGALQTTALAEALWRWGGTEYLQRDPGFRSLDSADFTLAGLYATAAKVAPRASFTQFNFIDDQAQIRFLGALGAKTGAPGKLISEGLEEVSSATDSFHSYTAPGRLHSILRSGSFYTLSVENVKFLDWFNALLDGDEIGNVAPRTATSKKP